MTTVSIITTYDSTTRELSSVATLTGFVESLPTNISSATQFDSITFNGGAVLSASDLAHLQHSAARALRTANADLAEWAIVGENTDKAGDIVGATIDPIGVFDDALNPPT